MTTAVLTGAELAGLLLLALLMAAVLVWSDLCYGRGWCRWANDACVMDERGNHPGYASFADWQANGAPAGGCHLNFRWGGWGLAS